MTTTPTTTPTPTTTTTTEAVPAGSDYMQWIEYTFYLAIIAGVFFVAYQVMSGRWRLLERQLTPLAPQAEESTAQENA